MSDPNDYTKALASSEHVRTIAAMMQQDGIDITTTTDETHGGIPFVTVIVQGQFHELTDDWARSLQQHIEKLRQSAREQAERG